MKLNLPPETGFFTVSPVDGGQNSVAISTIYKIKADGYTNLNTPIKYKF